MPRRGRNQHPVETRSGRAQYRAPTGICRSVLALLLSQPLPLAAAAPAGIEVFEEVYVYAQKRPQSMQVVPVAVEAFSGRELDTAGIRDAWDLAAISPSLQVRTSSNLKATRVMIRGLGNSTNNFGIEPAVAIYVDGVYRARPGSMLNELVDLSSVEVLRGPQGTLFGRNALVGAVLFNTVAPGHRAGDGFVELSAGNFDLASVRAAGSLSAIDEVLALRGTAFAVRRDGYVDDVSVGGSASYERDRRGLRLQALYTPSDSLSLRFIADYAELDENCCAAPVLQDNFRPVALPPGETSYAGTDEVARSLGANLLRGNRFYDYKSALSFAPAIASEDRGVALIADWAAPAFTLTSITGYRDYRSDDRFDGDQTDLDSIDTVTGIEQRAWSQELRITGEVRRLTYVAGLYFFGQELDSVETLKFGQDINGVLSHSFVWFPDTNNRFPLEAVPDFPYPLLPLIVPDSGAVTRMAQDHAAWAAFGQVDYDLSGSLTLTAGLRYTREQKELSGIFTQGRAPDYRDNVIAIEPVLEAFPEIAPRDPVDESLDDDRVTGNLRLSWFPTEDAMLYAAWSTGFKSSATNTRRINPVYDYVLGPETSRALELGLKTEFPRQRLRLDLALHRTQVDDLQVNSFDQGGFVLQNAAAVDTWGGELELSWRPTSTLALSLAWARTEGEFEDFDNGPCRSAAPFHTGQPDPGDPTGGENTGGCDRSGDNLDHNPEFLLLTARRSFRLADDIGGFLLAEYSRLGEADVPSNDPFLQAPSYDLLNLRLTLQFDRYDTWLTLWGRNVLDEHYRLAGNTPFASDGRVVSYPREPATWGVTLRKQF